MTETKTIWLDETDLKRILAEKFKTDENSISFKTIDPDGYGIHIETKIENVREKGDCYVYNAWIEAVSRHDGKVGEVDGR